MPNSITPTSSQQMCPMVLMCGTVLLVFQLSLPLMTASVLILLLCQTVLISLSYEYSSFYSPLTMIFTLLSIHLKADVVIPSIISMPFPLPLRMESLCCPLLYSFYLPCTSSDFGETVIPPDILMNLTCFNNLKLA